MHIRTVQNSDNPVLAHIIRSVFEEYDAPKENTVYSDTSTDHLYELFRREKSVLWVAEIDDEIVGCCGIYPTDGLPPECAELVKFYLSSQARGKGVGRALMEKSVRSAKDFGYTEIYIESMPEFGGAVNIYGKQGFRYLKQPLGNSGHTGCTIWMLKELSSDGERREQGEQG